MALGFFDGVHIGHQEVIKTAKSAADKKNLPLVVMSFFPHPKEVLSREKKIFPYLMPLDEKQKKLEQLGVQIFYLVHFDREFAALSPKQFVKNYLLDFGAQLIVAGFDFTYGYKGEGNMDRLIEDSNGILDAIKVGKIGFEGEKISSTMIRNLLHLGNVERISSFLGEPYYIEGTVLLNREDIKVHIHPYYLLPASSIYRVILSNGRDTFKQDVLIQNRQLLLNFSQKRSFPFAENEVIRIYLERNLTNAGTKSSDQIQLPLVSLMS